MKVNQTLNHWYNFFSSPYTVSYLTEMDESKNLVLYRFLFKKKNCEADRANNYFQFSEQEKLSSIQLTAYKIIFHDSDLVICICLEINHTLLAFDWNFLEFMYDYSKSPLPPPSISLLRPHINDFQSNIKKNPLSSAYQIYRFDIKLSR